MVLDVKECIKVDKSPVSDGIYPRLHLREEIGGTRWRSLHPYEPKLTDAEAIKNCITECHTRIEMGLHYRIPYPRPANHPQIELHDYTGSYAFTYQGSNFYNSHSKSLYFSCRYIYLLWDLLIKKDASLKCKRG
ncbi:LYR motif containing protein 1 isoform X5 [Rhinoraja longicauda]